MHDLISKIRTFYNKNIGTCTTCMRQSLAAALAMWGVFGAAAAIWPQQPASGLAGLLAAGLTTLWMLHVTAYAARTMARERNRHRQAPTGPDMLGRRHALKAMLRATAVGVSASVPVLLWSTNGFAFCGQCTFDRDCGSSGSNWCCKNTAPVNAGYVCNECKKCV